MEAIKPSFFTRHIVAISLNFSVIILFFCASNINWGGKNWEDILDADAKGYYAYLPATFLYNDLNFGFFDEIEKNRYYHKEQYYDYRKVSNGKTIDKYFCGTALSELPFFLLAHVYAFCSDYPADGFSKPYLVFINIAGICYVWMAFFFVSKILRRYQIKDKIIAFCIPVFIFGTNIFQYCVNDPGMSHVYSLAFFAMFVYSALLFFQNPGRKHLINMALLLGIIILIRPSNAMIVFSLPFIAGSGERLSNVWKYLLKSPMILLYSSIICLSIVFIQLLIYKISTGQFLVYAYNEERFYFTKPHVLEILFSYRRGLFLYTPIVFISFAGYYFMTKKRMFGFLSHFLFLFLVTYVLSCWWVWWYGGGFSCRVFIEYFPFYMIPFAFLLQGIRNKGIKVALNAFVVLLVLICQVQIYQYRHYYIHWENTTKEMYWENFLRIDKLL